MGNAIAKDSKLYGDLLAAYEIEDKVLRFEKCYTLIDDASYIDILFVISRLKELDSADDAENAITDTIKSVVGAIKFFFGSKSMKRRAYLLDLLEEAKERKRP